MSDDGPRLAMNLLSALIIKWISHLKVDSSGNLAGEEVSIAFFFPAQVLDHNWSKIIHANFWKGRRYLQPIFWEACHQRRLRLYSSCLAYWAVHKNLSHSTPRVRYPIQQSEVILNMLCAFMVKLPMAIHDQKTTQLIILRNNHWMLDIITYCRMVDSPTNSENVTFI